MTTKKDKFNNVHIHKLQKVPNLFTYFVFGLWPLHNIFITIMFVGYMIITLLIIAILIKINKFDVTSCMGVGIILVGCTIPILGLNQ